MTIEHKIVGAELLTAADVGRIAGVTPAAVRARAVSGKLPVAAVTASGMRLWTREAALKYKAERAAGFNHGASRMPTKTTTGSPNVSASYLPTITPPNRRSHRIVREGGLLVCHYCPEKHMRDDQFSPWCG